MIEMTARQRADQLQATAQTIEQEATWLASVGESELAEAARALVVRLLQRSGEVFKTI